MKNDSHARFSILSVLLAFSAVNLSAQPAYWQRTKGPVGGQITNFGRSADGTLFAGIRNDAIYRSTDQGRSWQPVGFPGRGSQQQKGYGFAADDKGGVLINLHGYYGWECYLSRDNGRSWQTISELHSYLIAVARNGAFYASVYSSVPLRQSRDGGQTWTDISGTQTMVNCFLPAEDGGMYAGTDQGMLYLRPADGAPSAISAAHIAPITSLAQGNGFIWAAGPKGLFRRPFRDATWKAVDTARSYTTVAVNESGAVFAAATSRNFVTLVRSLDQGQTWQELLHYEPNEYNDYPPGSLKLLAFDHAVLWSDDHLDLTRISYDNGESWTFPESGLYASAIGSHGLAENSLGHIFTLTGSCHIFASPDQGETWSWLMTAPPGVRFFSLAIDGRDQIWVSADSGQVFFTEDNGSHWQRREVSSASRPVTHIAFRGEGLAVAAADNIWISTDGGLTWRDSGFSPNAQALAFSRRGDILVGTYNGIQKSSDQGQTWTLVQGGLDFPGPSSDLPKITSLVCLPGGELIAAAEKEGGENPRVEGRLFRSTDDGDSWTEVLKVIGGDLAANDRGQVYCSGGWYSFDNGVAWTEISPPMIATAVLIDSHGYLYAGSSSTGVWRSAASSAAFTPVHSAGIGSDTTQAYGVAWADYDNDGRDDLFFACEGPNRLYHNNADGTFTRVMAGAVAADSEPSRGAAWGDYDNDGWIDLFVANEKAANSLYHNLGNGMFVKVTGQPLTTGVYASRAAAWADYDRDGLIDLFVAVREGNNLLYRNDGNGAFTRVTKGSIVDDGGVSMGCAWSDYDRDGDPDLFVANYEYGGNFLYRNDGSGVFTRILSDPVATDKTNAFGGSWGDYDNDGWPDLFVTNTEMRNAAFHNNGDGTFTLNRYLASADTAICKGGAWEDINNDGWLDLYLAVNGTDLLFLNQSGANLALLKTLWFNTTDNSLACAWGDADQDGLLDLAVANAGTPSILVLNHFFATGNHWAEIRCVGTLSNRAAIGARVEVKATINDRGIWQNREISSQSGHSGQNSLAAHFGLGDAAVIDTLRIFWPSGRTQTLTALRADQRIIVKESEAASVAVQEAVVQPFVFSLAQNYPNPFNPVTTIEFTLPKSADVRLCVFSLLGEVVTELAAGPMPAGAHKLSWNADQCGSGVYFIRLDAGEYSAVRKAVYIK